MALQEHPANGAAAAPSSSLLSSSTLIDPSTLSSQADADAYARKLFQQGGDDLVRKMLKDAINQARQMDQDVLREKRKADADQKLVDDDLSKQSLKLEQRRLEIKDQCAKVLRNNQLIEQILTKLETENPDMTHLMSVRQKFVDETTSIGDKAEKQLLEAAALREETETLREDFEGRKKDFDAKVQAKIATWKESETQSSAKITEIQMKLQRQLLMQSKVSREEDLLANLQQAIEQLQIAEKAYVEKNAEFERLIDQSKEALDLYQKNIDIRTKNVSILEDEKKKNHDDEQMMRETLHKLKSSGLKEMKRRVQNLEKEKQALEKKSRELLASAKK